MNTVVKKSDFSSAEAVQKALESYRNDDVMDAQSFFIVDEDGKDAPVQWAPFSGTALDFKCVMTKAVYQIPGSRMARPVPKGRGVPDAYIINDVTGDVLDAVSSDWYQIVDNEQMHNATLKGLEAALPASFLNNTEVEMLSGRSGAFSQCIIDVPELHFDLRNGTGKTTLSAVVVWKNDLKLSTQVSVMARDNETGGLINLGVTSTKAQRHKKNWNEDAIIEHIDDWINVKFADRIDRLQDMMRTSASLDQMDTALMVGGGRLLSDGEAEKIRSHIIEEEIPFYGKSKFAVMSGLAAFCSDPEAFPVRNSEVEDNVAETLASRQGQVAKLVMTHFFYGRGDA